MTSSIVKEFKTVAERLERALIENIALSVVLGYRTYEEGLSLLLGDEPSADKAETPDD